MPSIAAAVSEVSVFELRLKQFEADDYEVVLPLEQQVWEHDWPMWRPDGRTLDELAALDPGVLTDRQRLDCAAAVDKCVRRAEAVRTRLLAAAAGATPGDPAQDVAVHTLAGLLHLMPKQTTGQVMFAREMVSTFADTLAAVEQGQIPMQHARTLSHETVGLTPEQAAEVERRVLPKAAQRTPYQHTEAVRRTVKQVAPRPAAAEPGSPEDERRADVRASGPWRSGLWMEGPLEQMAVIAARMTAGTVAPRGPQDTRTLPQRKFERLFEAVAAKTSVFIDLVGYVNPDGTISLPALPGIDDLSPAELATVVTGGSVRFHNPAVKPPATDAYQWTTEQRRYVCARDRTCRFPGCTVAAERCELDHITPHSQGGRTDVDNGVALCKRHHRVKHQPGWKVERSDDGTVIWTGPTDHVLIAEPWRHLNRE
ncbi:MAG TPA: HNH endonuclease signature motif containing protein [Mycobacteriales bacterium]|nr:HNH endonuclease signature motif containing protein [Mycobacteriales bacterium]